MTATSDQLIGGNVRALRGPRPQASLAISMALLGGWSSWNKSTVSKVEAGERSLKLAEAVTVCEILECSLDDLVGA